MAYRRDDDRITRRRIERTISELEQLGETVASINADLEQDDATTTMSARFSLSGANDYLVLARSALVRGRERLPEPEPNIDIRKAMAGLRGGGS